MEGCSDVRRLCSCGSGYYYFSISTISELEFGYVIILLKGKPNRAPKETRLVGKIEYVLLCICSRLFFIPIAMVKYHAAVDGESGTR